MLENRIKGFCKDCFYLQQEYHIIPSTKNKELELVIDTYCGMCGLFKRLDGYCDFFTT